MREGWEYKRFEEVFDLQMGKTPDRKNRELFNGKNIWVSIRDLRDKYIYTSTEYISDEAASNIKLVKKGTVVMSFKLTVGKCGIAAEDLYTNEAIMAFNPKDDFNINSSFLYYYLQNYNWYGANKAVMGLTLNKATISKQMICIPPLTVQQSIVSELDKLSELISLKKEQLKDYDNLAKSLFNEMFGDPIENEKAWEVNKLGEVFVIGSGGTPSKGNNEYWLNGNIPWIGSNMCQNCIINKTDGKYITEAGLLNSSAKMLEPGTILIALVGATIGKVGLLRTSTSTNQNIAYIKVNENPLFCSEYMFFHLMTQYQEFMKIGQGKFKMANLTFIRSMDVICPPLSLQQSFATKIEQIENQKSVIERQIADLETLLASRMQYWFE